MTENEYLQTLVEEVGGPSVLAARQLELAWGRYSGISDLELRYNYALIQAIKFLMGKYWPDYKIRTAGGQQLDLDQPFAHLFQLAQEAQSRIDLILAGPQAPSADYGAQVDEMEARYPLPTPSGYLPDPNSPRYSGDPLWAVRED